MLVHSGEKPLQRMLKVIWETVSKDTCNSMLVYIRLFRCSICCQRFVPERWNDRSSIVVFTNAMFVASHLVWRRIIFYEHMRCYTGTNRSNAINVRRSLFRKSVYIGIWISIRDLFHERVPFVSKFDENPFRKVLKELPNKINQYLHLIWFKKSILILDFIVEHILIYNKRA